MCNSITTEYEKYINYQTKETLDLERVNKLKDNAMLKVMPDLWCKWNFEKNNELDLDIWGFTFKNSAKAWWYCDKCDDSYPQRIDKKTGGSGCTICAGKYVTPVNALATNRPDIASEWHPTLNGELTPHDVTVKSSKKVWWQCLKHKSHKWSAHITDRTTKTNSCPYCASRKLMVGFNDMWSTNPELASMLANPEDGYKYMQKSSIKVDWKCFECGGIIKDKSIANVNLHNVLCSDCSNAVSIPEKIMMNVLKGLKVKYVYNTSFEWSDRKRYDFYIPSMNIIIETHGSQHFNGSFGLLGGRSLSEEQSNDQYKYEMAIQNGIKEYIAIDCRKSGLSFIKNNILDSKLAQIFDLNQVNWLAIGKTCKVKK